MSEATTAVRDLEGKIALVTGALAPEGISRGIGYCT
jgi:hypothetical protein